MALNVDRNEKKHLFDPRKNGNLSGRWFPEFDPIMTSDSWHGVASVATVAALGIVGTSRVLFAYGFVISNMSTMNADVWIKEGATTKLRTRVIGHDTIIVGHGNPRAPICRFNALAPVRIVAYSVAAPAAATVRVTMSWWDAELT